MNDVPTPGARSLWHIFRWPLVLGVSGLLGLTAALVGNGAYDMLSWVMLGALPATICACWRRASHARSR